MADSLAGVVLGAGFGTRLLPLTRLRPKVLCPVGNVALVDHVLARMAAVTGAIAVNVHHHRAQMEAHLAGRVHLSIEAQHPLGTAGALGALRDWIDGRPTLVVNGDSFVGGSGGGLRPLVDGWDGEKVRVLVPGDGLGPGSPVAGCLLPWADVAGLGPEPAGIYDTVWRPAQAEGRLEVVPLEDPFFDCGTPRAYLAANLATSGGQPVIGPGAVVEGEVVRSVVWPGAVVWRGERLVDAIRADGLTVLVR